DRAERADGAAGRAGRAVAARAAARVGEDLAGGRAARAGGDRRQPDVLVERDHVRPVLRQPGHHPLADRALDLRPVRLV
ncbi:MAG: hypothetical protein AVDCRST_MAG85-4285, partial [uncultured Solirubrobacteraceae bacterium]